MKIIIISLHMSHFVIIYLFRTVYNMLSFYNILFSIIFVHSNCDPNTHNLTTLDRLFFVDRLLVIMIPRTLKFQKQI